MSSLREPCHDAASPRFINDPRLRNLSPRTIECYVAHVAAFARHFGRSPEQLDREHIREYQLHLRDEKLASCSLFNQAVCGLRFFYKVTLPSPWAMEHIPHGTRPKSLPVVLSREEVQRVLACVERPVHRLLLTTLHAAGLRLSEGLRLQVSVWPPAARLRWVVTCGNPAGFQFQCSCGGGRNRSYSRRMGIGWS